MSDTENQVDLNTPPSEQEVQEWVSKLAPEEKLELRRQQIQHAAVTRGRPEDVDLGEPIVR